MKINWGKERVMGFSDPIKKAEEVKGWSWWVLFAAGITIGILIILKIFGKI